MYKSFITFLSIFSFVYKGLMPF